MIHLCNRAAPHDLARHSGVTHARRVDDRHSSDWLADTIGTYTVRRQGHPGHSAGLLTAVRDGRVDGRRQPDGVLLATRWPTAPSPASPWAISAFVFERRRDKVDRGVGRAARHGGVRRPGRGRNRLRPRADRLGHDTVIGVFFASRHRVRGDAVPGASAVESSFNPETFLFGNLVFVPGRATWFYLCGLRSWSSRRSLPGGTTSSCSPASTRASPGRAA